MMLMGLLCWLILSLNRGRRRQTALVLAAAGTTLLVSLLTPPLWTTWRPRWLPWPIESYINGVHNLGKPQAWLFPVFPWTAFAFAGLAIGFILLSERMRNHENQFFALLGAGGLGLIFLARWFE